MLDSTSELTPDQRLEKTAKTTPRELAAQKIQIRKQQEKLLSDLLTVVDALDHAADHWQQAANQQSAKRIRSSALSTRKTAWWKIWQPNVARSAPALESTPDAENLTEVVTSAREGIEMIRKSMLSILAQHQVTPMPVLGTPFDPTQMHALGQKADASAAPNTVVQEVVRGYRWQDRTLREAQVMVAIAPPEPS